MILFRGLVPGLVAPKVGVVVHWTGLTIPCVFTAFIIFSLYFVPQIFVSWHLIRHHISDTRISIIFSFITFSFLLNTSRDFESFLTCWKNCDCPISWKVRDNHCCIVVFVPQNFPSHLSGNLSQVLLWFKTALGLINSRHLLKHWWLKIRV